MPDQYSFTLHLVGGDRDSIQDLTIRVFDEGQNWTEIRKSLVSSFTEKVRFRLDRGDYDVLVSYVRDGKEWQTPFWGFSVPQVPEIRLDMATGGVIPPGQQDRAAIAEQWIKQKEPPAEVAEAVRKAANLK